jgi:hypothetical protein
MNFRQSPTFATDGNVWLHNSIAIRNNGHPIISYRGSNSLKAFDCANIACSSGTARALDSDGTVGEYPSIAIRHDGLPIISYRDEDNQDLKVLSCGDPKCRQ